MIPKLLLAAALFFAARQSWAAQRYPISGLVLRVDKEHQTLLVSHESIPGYMDSMVMPFRVRETKFLEGLQAGFDPVGVAFGVPSAFSSPMAIAST